MVQDVPTYKAELVNGPESHSVKIDEVVLLISEHAVADVRRARAKKVGVDMEIDCVCVFYHPGISGI